MTSAAIFCDACDLLGIEWRVMNALGHLGGAARMRLRGSTSSSGSKA